MCVVCDSACRDANQRRIQDFAKGEGHTGIECITIL